MGVLRGNEITEAVNHAYQNITKWRRNLFLVPTGKIGREFIDEVAKTITLFTSGSQMESVALSMVMIMFPLLLQKPSRKSKSKDHSKYLTNRLNMWRDGLLHDLVKEGNVIQKRLENSKRSPEHNEKVFARLMLQGKTSAALR